MFYYMVYQKFCCWCCRNRNRRKQRLDPKIIPEDEARKKRDRHLGSFLFVKKSELPPNDPEHLRDAPHIQQLMKAATLGRGYSKRGLWCLKNNYSYLRNHFYESEKGAYSFILSLMLFFLFYHWYKIDYFMSFKNYILSKIIILYRCAIYLHLAPVRIFRRRKGGRWKSHGQNQEVF